ncbi:hypothetical protein BH23PLA1_BH23PLA1_41720 [soil metagenome]
MDQGPLVTELIDAGAELIREFDKSMPVKAAFWLKASDDEHRYLYIASDRIDDSNPVLAYREVLRLVDQIGSPYLNPFRVKLISADDPLARAALEIQHRFPGPQATRLGARSFGGLSVDDVCIYQSPLPVAVP